MIEKNKRDQNYFYDGSVIVIQNIQDGQQLIYYQGGARGEMKGMKNKMKFLRILFPMALFGASYIGYIMYTTTKGKVIGRLHTPTPFMNLMMLAIMCISLWLAYNFYKENEGE